jgi:serine/threonine protein kinase
MRKVGDDPDLGFVMKRQRLVRKYDFGVKELSRVQREALVMEKLSASSHILNIYGYCGTSVMVETMAFDIKNAIIQEGGVVSQSELSKSGQPKAHNNLTSSEQLKIAIEMAKSLADLHDFSGGKIVHADTNVEQWLLNKHGELKLNDFNLAEILQWNEETQQYCPTTNMFEGTFRLVRSPEEFMGYPADESKDIYSFGNMLYSLITGLWPFYGEVSREGDKMTIRAERAKLRHAIYNGTRPYIDDLHKFRDNITLKLIDVMKASWNKTPNKRPSMSEIVAMLHNIKEVAHKNGELNTTSELIKLVI